MTIPHQPSELGEARPKQVKSKWYYLFWGSATLVVVMGQIYIANSYRYLAELLQQSLT